MSSSRSKAQYYGVHKGMEPGVYETWEETSKQVTGFSGAIFKKFKTSREAEYFVVHGVTLPEVPGPQYNAPPLYSTRYPPIGVTRPSMFIVDSNDSTTASGRELILEVNKLIENKRAEVVVYSDADADIKVFTDGSRSSKTQRTGLGVAFDSPFDHLNLSERLPFGATHQEAELRAILKALQTIKANKYMSQANITVWTDSDYACKCLKNYMKVWLLNGWVTSSGKPVKHVEIIKEIDRIMFRHPKVKLRHISEVGLKSHMSKTSVAGMSSDAQLIWEGNRKADILASSDQ